MIRFANGLRSSFLDASLVLTELIANGDVVSARWTMSGTHDGAFHGIAATSTPITLEGIVIMRFDRGYVVEQWVSYDRLQLLQQVRAAPENQDAPSKVCPPCQTPE